MFECILFNPITDLFNLISFTVESDYLIGPKTLGSPLCNFSAAIRTVMEVVLKVFDTKRGTNKAPHK